jgi:hypothetical protein
MDSEYLSTVFSVDGLDLVALGAPTLSIPLWALPEGWTAPIELQILYAIALRAEGPILEVGPWLGRSTAAIAAGIRDSGSAKIFDTIDFGLTSIPEWREKLNDDFSRSIDSDTIVRSIHAPGGTVALLLENLRKLDLLGYVTSVIKGDFTEVPIRDRYGVIFCDTLHDENEVRKYCPKFNELLMPGGWLICDDVMTPKLGEIVKEYIIWIS